MNSLKKLLRIRNTYIGIGAAVLFQLIFFSVWLTAYKDVENRADQLTVGWVNEDEDAGSTIYDSLNETLPFQINSYSSLTEAKKALNTHKIQMLIQLPERFTQEIRSGSSPSIHFWVNSATSSTVKTIMEQAANEISTEVNKQTFSLQQDAVAQQFDEQIQQLPLPDPAPKELQQIAAGGIASLSSVPVQSELHKMNDPGTFSANLVPLMVIISSFVGAMVMIMQVEEGVSRLAAVSKWSMFGSRQLLNVSVALILPLLTLGLMRLFNITVHESIGMVYMFQAILYLTFLSFAQVFVYLFGSMGMVFNILALSLQLVTSGVLVSKELLSDNYQTLAASLPATYAAEGYFAIVFGGGEGALLHSIQYLLIILGVTLAIATAAVLVKRNKTGEVL